jgi:mannose-6-phosphate isomerase-like protein (cupin superfamily)
MDQIRQLRFEDFKEEKLAQGYREVLERRWEPHTENEFHHHDFTADVIVIEGEFWLTIGGKTKHFIPGESFHVPAHIKHKEKYGPEGCVFWVARV